MKEFKFCIHENKTQNNYCTFYLLNLGEQIAVSQAMQAH